MKVKVIGSGAWGTALAKLQGAEIIPGRAEAQKIDADIVIIAAKAQSLSDVLKRHDYGNATLVIAAKGIEQGSLRLMSELVTHDNIAILSGPNFASEVEKGLPAVASIACKDEQLGKKLIQALGKPTFRLYYSNDMIATQVGGAVKNIIAIAAGICAGKNLGENARAALITRGLAEMGRLCVSLGGKPENLMGPSGLGDLVLTATSEKSRNYKFGVDIANGKLIKDLLNSEGTKEGYFTAKSVHDLALKKSVEMPICNSIYQILYEGKNIDVAVSELLERPQK